MIDMTRMIFDAPAPRVHEPRPAGGPMRRLPGSAGHGGVGPPQAPAASFGDAARLVDAHLGEACRAGKGLSLVVVGTDPATAGGLATMLRVLAQVARLTAAGRRAFAFDGADTSHGAALTDGGPMERWFATHLVHALPLRWRRDEPAPGQVMAGLYARRLGFAVRGLPHGCGAAEAAMVGAASTGGVTIVQVDVDRAVELHEHLASRRLAVCSLAATDPSRPSLALPPGMRGISTGSGFDGWCIDVVDLVNGTV